MKTKRHQVTIPVTIPWTKNEWKGSTFDEIMTGPKMPEFLGAWEASLDDERINARLRECLKLGGAAFIANLNENTPMSRALARATEDGDTKAAILFLLQESLDAILGGKVPSIGNAERVEMAIACTAAIQSVLSEKGLGLKRGERKLLKDRDANTGAAIILYATLAVTDNLKAKGPVRLKKKPTGTKAAHKAAAPKSTRLRSAN